MLLFLVLCFILHLSYAAKTTSKVVNYVADETNTGDLFPSCVEVADVWPRPGSVLRFNTDILHVGSNMYNRVIFHITFSKPVAISTKDTTAGLNPLHQKRLRILRRHRAYYVDANWGLDTGPFAPIFLSPSSNLTTVYHPFRTLHNWRGSNRTYLATFAIMKRGFPQVEKALLGIDGGRFYTYEWVGSQLNRVYVPLTIIGEYYFEPFLKNHPWFNLPKPTMLKSSPHCAQRGERPFYGIPDVYSEQETQSLSKLMVQVKNESHILEAAEDTTETDSQNMALYFSIITSGGGGTKTLSLPATVKARYFGYNVTVKLPSGSITITQASSPQLFVPVERKLIYELRERIYHNGYKLSSMVERPAFAKTVFSGEPLDKLDNVFPQRILSTKIINHWEWFNMDIVDKETGVKLAWYYPFFAGKHIRGTGNVLWYNKWFEVTRAAPLVAQMDKIGYVHKYPQSQIMKKVTKANFLGDNSKLCPPGSKRSQGRSGMRIEHVIEYGSMYHMIVPKPFNTWWSEETTLKAEITTDAVTKKHVKIRQVYGNREQSSFPSVIREALDKYVCLLRPRKSVSKPRSWSAVNEKWINLDECIFVPRHVAESSDCGGLMLFKNVPQVISQPDFCNKEHSSCIGVSYTSLDRFPVLPTYGLHELTGWIPCRSNRCKHFESFLSHPVGRYAVERGEFALPRSVLKITEKRSGVGEAVLKLLPVFDASSKMEYHLTINSGLKILRPAIGVVYDNTTNAPSTDNMKLCGKILRTELSVMETKHVTSAQLIATVYNTGEAQNGSLIQGGGDFIFEMKCTKYLSFTPSSKAIRVWINPSSAATVRYTVSGELSTNIAKMLHKCELTVRIEGPHSSQSESLLVCNKGIITYYGYFQDPCHEQIEVPDVDLMYYVLPPAELKQSQVFQYFNNSPPVANKLTFMRAITLTLQLLWEEDQENQLRMLHQLKISCTNGNIVVIQEDQLLLTAALIREGSSVSEITNKPIVFHRDFDTNKRVYFFSTVPVSSLDRTSCSVELSCWRPNWQCKRKVDIIETMFIPLTKEDSKVMKKQATHNSILSVIFGHQSSGVYASLIACMVVSFILMVTTATGHGLKYAYRKKIPKPAKLKSLNREVQQAEKKEQQYWENPQVFLTAGDHVFGAHFLLHNFKATQPLDSEQIKSLKIAATLKRGREKELQVLFGHVKKVFLNRDDADIWVQASSGMYRLPVSNVAPEYKTTLMEFLERNGVNTTKITEQLPQRKLPQSDDDDGTKETSEGCSLIREQGAKEEQKPATEECCQVENKDDNETESQEQTRVLQEASDASHGSELDDMLIDLDY